MKNSKNLMFGILTVFMLVFIADTVTAQSANPTADKAATVQSQIKPVPQTGKPKVASKHSPGNEYVIIKQQRGHSKHQTYLRRIDSPHASVSKVTKGEIVKSKVNGHSKRKTKKECWHQ